jgi:hypothetical protein
MYSAQHNNIVAQGLIMHKRKGAEAAKCLMMRAGLPVEIIDTLLIRDKQIVNNLNLTASLQEPIQK